MSITSLVREGRAATQPSAVRVEAERNDAGSASSGVEFVHTQAARPGESATAFFERLAAHLRREPATILALMIYGRTAAHAEATEAMRAALGETRWPVTWVEGASCEGAPLVGVQVFARRGGSPVERVVVGGHVLGTIYDDGAARHCLLGGLGPTAVAMDRPAQVQQMFATLDAALDLAGFTLSDVVRTWFFNDDILAWYDAFNRVRSAFYAPITFRTGTLPASTGVSGRNPAGAATAVAAWAVRPHGAGASVRDVPSPLQCPAPAYGSAFSRAVEIDSAGVRRLLVSGTASIEPGGKTVWQGDIAKQIGLTMDVVEAILRSRGMGFADVTRANAYCKRPEYLPYFRAWQQVHGATAMPALPIHCDICRDDLLFEIEVDARREG